MFTLKSMTDGLDPETEVEVFFTRVGYTIECVKFIVEKDGRLQMQKAACGTVDLLAETVVEMAPGPDKMKLSRMIAETVPSMLNQAGSKAKGSVREPGRKTFELIMAKAYSKRALDLTIAHGVQHASYFAREATASGLAILLESMEAARKPELLSLIAQALTKLRGDDKANVRAAAAMANQTLGDYNPEAAEIVDKAKDEGKMGRNPNKIR